MTSHEVPRYFSQRLAMKASMRDRLLNYAYERRKESFKWMRLFLALAYGASLKTVARSLRERTWRE